MIVGSKFIIIHKTNSKRRLNEINKLRRSKFEEMYLQRDNKWGRTIDLQARVWILSFYTPYISSKTLPPLQIRTNFIPITSSSF